MGNIMFIEQQDEEEYISEYMFYLEENKLFIDRRKYESDSANVILSSNLYEVDISENECWLYNLLDKDKKGYCRSKLRMESI